MSIADDGWKEANLNFSFHWRKMHKNLVGTPRRYRIYTCENEKIVVYYKSLQTL